MHAFLRNDYMVSISTYYTEQAKSATPLLARRTIGLNHPHDATEWGLMMITALGLIQWWIWLHLEWLSFKAYGH